MNNLFSINYLLIIRMPFALRDHESKIKEWNWSDEGYIIWSYQGYIRG